MQKLRAHPDLGGDDWNAALLNEALAVLSNPEKRKQYDRERAATRTMERNQADIKPQTRSQRPPQNPGHSTSRHPPCSFCGAPSGTGFTECLRCQSPLSYPAASSPSLNDKRNFQRMDIQHPVEIYTVWPQPDARYGRVHNLTPNGVMITLDHPLEADQVIKLASSLLDSVSRVASCYFDNKRQRFVLGLEFITLRINQPKGTFISENV